MFVYHLLSLSSILLEIKILSKLCYVGVYFETEPHMVVQTGFEFVILLPLPLESWDYRHGPPTSLATIHREAPGQVSAFLLYTKGLIQKAWFTQNLTIPRKDWPLGESAFDTWDIPAHKNIMVSQASGNSSIILNSGVQRLTM